MKLLLDTCVLYPTVMREMLIGAARAGAFEPLWSARILEEWRRAVLKHGEAAALDVMGQSALLNAAFPRALVRYPDEHEARFWLPDPSDIHVIAAAAIGGADGIVTMNNKDFPAGILAEEALSRVNPDALLYGFWQGQPEMIAHVARGVLDKANALSGQGWSMKDLMKKARMPRLGKALIGA
ncbi:RSP_2648 family PIN domain-containing protein [Planktotalea arctica]|uniref:RSP_2648 family PIN domain-containing protein n=1 Tax=Planktotalea arctica TaxID=1481893 RepID=UPI00321AC913